MKIEIKDFEDFVKSRIAGKVIINHYWLEYLLNLFYQGYVGEVWIEVQDTLMNHKKVLENNAYGIIGRNFDKKHLNLNSHHKSSSETPNQKQNYDDKESMEKGK